MNHFLFVLPLSALAVFIFLPFSQALVLCVPLFVVYSFFCRIAWKDWHRPVTLGVEGMIGGIAQVMENGAGQVKVFYRGEIMGRYLRGTGCQSQAASFSRWNDHGVKS